MASCQIFVRFLSESASPSLSSSSENQLLAPLAAGSQFGAHTLVYRPYTEQIFRTIRRWSPEYIACASPFIGCLILGPAAIHLRVTNETMGTNPECRSACIETDLIKLALTHIARFWKIGLVLQGKTSIMVLWYCLSTDECNKTWLM